MNDENRIECPCVVAYTNQLGKTNGYVYDSAGRKTSERTPNGELLQYTYTPAGDLLTLQDGLSQTTTWGYDAYGRVISKKYANGVTNLTYAYDAAGRLTNRWSQAKGNTGYTYDNAGNLTFVNYPASPDVTLGYDALNRVTNMVDAAGTTRYTFTSAGNLLTEDSPWATDTVTYTYHASVPHLRTGLTLQQPAGSWTQGYGYDGVKRLQTVTGPMGTFTYAYRGAGTLWTNLALPNTSRITNGFDTVARLTTTRLNTSGGATLNYHGYTYNQGSQRSQQTRTDASTVTYTYDNLGQVKTAVGSGGLSTENLGYAYDAAWNLSYRTNSGTPTTFTANNLNQLTAGPYSPFTYDYNGNLTAMGGGAMTSATYDDENRLSALEYTGTWRFEFTYDGISRLRKRVDYAWSAGWVLSAETRYVYDGWRVIQERNSANTPTVSYTRGWDLGAGFEAAGGIGGLLARSHGYSGGSWTTHNYYHADGNGNVTYLVDATQALAASYRYDPYGRTLGSSGGLASANVYRFSTKEIIPNSGTYYYGYRFYDPYSQRWLNRDPLQERGGINLYVFCRNAPVSLIDRSGLDAYLVTTIGGGPVSWTDHVDLYVDNPDKGFTGSSAAWGEVKAPWFTPILPKPDDSTIVKRIPCSKSTDKEIADFMKARKSSRWHVPTLSPYCASWVGECLNAGFPGAFPKGAGTSASGLSKAADDYTFIGPRPPQYRDYFGEAMMALP